MLAPPIAKKKSSAATSSNILKRETTPQQAKRSFGGFREMAGDGSFERIVEFIGGPVALDKSLAHLT